jgi:hypothetical protein
VSEGQFASGVGICLTACGIDGDVPETGAWRGDLGRKPVKRTAMIGVPTTIFEAAKIRIVHQANIAGLRAFDDDKVVLVEMLTLVYEFHDGLRNGGFSEKSKR